MRCSVFCAVSLDGFLARPDGSLDWLPGAEPDDTPTDPPDGGAAAGGSHTAQGEVEDSSGYHAFVASVDVLLMGRATYDAVRGFGIGWPYELPVRVLTHRPLTDVADGEDVSAVAGDVEQVLDALAAEGHGHVYADGGQVIQQLLAADRVDELVLTTVPVLLGDGLPLFGPLPADRSFVAGTPRLLPGGMVQTRFARLPADG